MICSRYRIQSTASTIGAVLVCLAAMTLMGGCQKGGTSEGKMSQADINNFKGGPMPADYWQKHPMPGPPKNLPAKK